MYTVKDNILGKKVCWRLATNQPKNCRKIGQRCVCQGNGTMHLKYASVLL